jgi:glucose dehydrogenase
MAAQDGARQRFRAWVCRVMLTPVASAGILGACAFSGTGTASTTDAAGSAGRTVDPTEWPSYGRDVGGTRFSPLTQIHRGNVSRLEPAWVYRTGDTELRGKSDYRAGGRLPAFQATPLVVGGVMYLSTPSSRVIALEAETGREIWRFDPFVDGSDRVFRAHRGVAFWSGIAADGVSKVARVLYGTSDGRLISLDAATGKPDGAFGTGGSVDLKDSGRSWINPQYSVTSPPAVYGDLVITGAEVPEWPARGPSGDVRAFDIRTGEMLWRFHTVPRPGEPGHESWEGDSWRDRTGANVWSIMSVDAERGIVFLPIGAPGYDFYGGDRPGSNLYANSLVALDASSGTRLWHQQLVHHDLWDYDLPAQPVLATIRRDAEEIAVVVQVTKMGFVFVFDRATGESLFPIEQRPVPRSDVPGEASWPTQPFPLQPDPLVRQTAVTRDEITTVTPESHAYCMRLFEQSTSGGLFTPPGLGLTIIFPGTLGGGTWSGGSFDPTSHLFYVNVNEVGSLVRMEPQADDAPLPYRRGGPSGEYGRFWDDNRLPCQQPPWGRLVAVDLASGSIAWSVPLGVVDALRERGIAAKTGAPNLGGSIATAGGLVFVAGTNDRRFRAFDSATGEELWETILEASGHATPITFLGHESGKQYVVITAGGGGLFSQDAGDSVVAFTIPE